MTQTLVCSGAGGARILLRSFARRTVSMTTRPTATLTTASVPPGHTRWPDTARSAFRFSSRRSSGQRLKKSTNLPRRSGRRDRPHWRRSRPCETSGGAKELASQGPPGCRALHLEDDRIAADVCRIDDRPDPIQRTVFIDELPAWHGDVTRLATYCQARLMPRCGRASASISRHSLGTVDCRGTRGLEACAHAWYETASDGVTHSAAGWALRQWGIEAPALPATSQPSEGRQWVVNSLGMTLLEIKPGVFVRKDQTPEAKEQTVQLTRAFFSVIGRSASGSSSSSSAMQITRTERTREMARAPAPKSARRRPPGSTGQLVRRRALLQLAEPKGETHGC